MKSEDFKIIGNLQYGDFALADYMYNEIVIDDTYGLKKLKNIKTIVDIGGNLGVFSVYARELFPEARIISIEALYDTYLSLRENTKNHNIEVYNIALGDGSFLFLKKCPDHSGANQFKKEESNLSIKSKTLREIFEDLKIEKPYMIKIDIEGSEMFLYEDNSCIEILRNCSYFTMEYHNVNMLGYEVNKEKWDDWLKTIFNNFNIEGLGGNATGATYRISK